VPGAIRLIHPGMGTMNISLARTSRLPANSLFLLLLCSLRVSNIIVETRETGIEDYKSTSYNLQ
jgi:hypothetical protein